MDASPVLLRYRSIELGERVFFISTESCSTSVASGLETSRSSDPLCKSTRAAGVQRSSAAANSTASRLTLVGCLVGQYPDHLAGVSIGSPTVIQADSIVTRDVPEAVFATGNPCRVSRVIGGDEAFLVEHLEVLGMTAP